MDCPFPIGSIFITIDKKNPSSIRAGTSREPFGKGRTIVCVNDQSTTQWLKTPGQTGGSGTFQTVTAGQGGASAVAASSTNYQPSISAYIWVRVQSTTNYNPFNEDLTQDGGKQLLNPFVIQERDTSLNTTTPKKTNPYQPG